MAAVGSKETKKIALGYETDVMYEAARELQQLSTAAYNEAGVNLFSQPGEFFRNEWTNQSMRDSFVNNSYDAKDPKYSRKADLEAHLENMNTLYDNDRDGILNESSALGAYTPVIGMALPIHKNILMNSIFDQVMPKDVARSPKFTLTLETRTLVDTQGNEIDMYLEQNLIKPAIDASIPQMDQYFDMSTMAGLAQDAVAPFFTANGPIGAKFAEGGVLPKPNMQLHNLSMRSGFTKLYIPAKGLDLVAGQFVYTAKDNAIVTDATTHLPVATKVDADRKGADGEYLAYDIDAHFTPGYGDNTRQLNKRLVIKVTIDGKDYELSTTLMGYVDDKNAILVQNTPFVDMEGGASVNDLNLLLGTDLRIAFLTFHAILDVSSAAFPTVKTKWSTVTNFYEIPEAPHVSVPISPEEVKDIAALYDINQITKLMSQIRLALVNWKDDSIRDELNQSFLTMPARQKVAGAIDWAPPLNYNGTPIQWNREMFMFQLDKYVTRMLQVLNDENMTIGIFGRPEIIKSIVPQTYTYQTPSNIGPVELDFKRTVVTSEKRVYNFVSSNKLRNNNNLILILIPRNSMRITYKVIDYQMYVSNEIRDTQNYQLPAMTAFERWLFLQYQPVQGRIQIKNVSGVRENLEAEDYIGTYAMNDDTANTEQYATQVNGVIDKETGNMKLPPIKTE